MKLGMAHEEVDAFHSSPLLLVVVIGISESPIPLFVSASGPYLIPLLRKGIEFVRGYVCTQRAIDRVENVSESHKGAVGRVNVDDPWKVSGCDSKERHGWCSGWFIECSSRRMVVSSNRGYMIHKIPTDCRRLQKWVRTRHRG